VLGEGSTTDVPPAAFGRFRVLHQIAVGSLGPVFRGEDPDTHRPVAIIHLQRELGRQAALLAVGALRDLVGVLPDHPSLAQPIDAGLHDQRPYLVTALAHGEPLDVALDTYGPAAITDALPRLDALADALDRAASLKIWHGTLEPSDIMVSADETVLTGMGVAQLVDPAGAAAGGAHQAPEAASGSRFSAAADQFAFAAIAYEWLFGQAIGRLPGMRPDVPNLPDVDRDGLGAAFARALSVDPTQRFPTCAAFVEALRRATVVERRSRARAGDNVAVLRPTRALRASAPEANLPFESEEAAGDGAAAESPMVAEPAARHSFRDLDLAGPEGAAKTEPVVASGGSFSMATVAAALAGGMAIGAIGGYLLARLPEPRTNRETRSGVSTARAEPTGREFTDTPMASQRLAGADTPDRASADSAPPPAPPVEPRPAPTVTADAVPAARSDNARLLVRSTPAGATVTVDGTARGTTPLALRDLSFGTRLVAVGRTGYTTVERRVSLSADRPSRSLDVALVATRAGRPTAQAAPATGVLTIDSRPAGAAVSIDGRVAGKTPLILDRLAPGAHTVRIERSGYRPWATTVDVKAGERARVAASLLGGRDPE
jgi:hypothetical protein